MTEATETRTKMIVVELRCGCGAQCFIELPTSVAHIYAEWILQVGKAWVAVHSRCNDRTTAVAEKEQKGG